MLKIVLVRLSPFFKPRLGPSMASWISLVLPMRLTTPFQMRRTWAAFEMQGAFCWGKIMYLFALFFPWHLTLAYMAGQAPDIFLARRVVLHVSFCGFLMWWWMMMGHWSIPQFRWCPYCWWSLRRFLVDLSNPSWIFGLPWEIPCVGDELLDFLGTPKSSLQ